MTQRQLLDFRRQNFAEKQCELDTYRITTTSNACNFMGRYFTQIDGATIGGLESASVIDIYGTVFIDSKIEENIINEDNNWKRYRHDSFSISLQISKDTEIEKIKWINENTLKDKIKFTMEFIQDEMIFLNTKLVTKPIAGKKDVITTDIYSKKQTLTSI